MGREASGTSMNTAMHSSTGMSPAMLFYGRQSEPPGTHCRLQEVASEAPAQEESLARWKDRLDALPELYQRATSQARAAQDLQAGYYDAGRREPHFKPGDRVWKRGHTLSSVPKGIAAKLAPKFKGLYWITVVLGSNTYQLVGEGGQAEEIMAADQLKPYHGDSPESVEVDGKGNFYPARLVSLETGAIPKRARGDLRGYVTKLRLLLNHLWSCRTPRAPLVGGVDGLENTRSVASPAFLFPFFCCCFLYCAYEINLSSIKGNLRTLISDAADPRRRRGGGHFGPHVVRLRGRRRWRGHGGGPLTQ